MTPSKILTWDPMVNECGNIIDVADLRAQHLNEFVLCVWTDLSLHLASAMCMAASTRPLGLFCWMLPLFQRDGANDEHNDGQPSWS